MTFTATPFSNLTFDIGHQENTQIVMSPKVICKGQEIQCYSRLIVTSSGTPNPFRNWLPREHPFSF